jgi:hypothetical protein
MVGIAFSWVIGVVGHAGGQRLAPYEQRDPGRRIWPGAERPDRLSLPANDAYLLSGHGGGFDARPHRAR